MWGGVFLFFSLKIQILLFSSVKLIDDEGYTAGKVQQEEEEKVFSFLKAAGARAVRATCVGKRGPAKGKSVGNYLLSFFSLRPCSINLVFCLLQGSIFLLKVEFPPPH